MTLLDIIRENYFRKILNKLPNDENLFIPRNLQVSDQSTEKISALKVVLFIRTRIESFAPKKYCHKNIVRMHETNQYHVTVW